MFEALNCVPRLLMQVDLKPVQGDRFQPTGFADLGAAVYERPDGKRMLLVESAQSVANRLEHACLEGDGPRLAQEFDGLPYVLVKLTGKVETETSSLVEAHRINSPFIITDKRFQEEFKRRAAYAKGLPLDWKKIGERCCTLTRIRCCMGPSWPISMMAESRPRVPSPGSLRPRMYAR